MNPLRKSITKIKRHPITTKVIRKPILAFNRRNAEMNPKFLDKEVLLERFSPLIQSMYRYFCSYDGMFNQQVDSQDLYSQIQSEFIELTHKYDPRRGVDFTGYIKFHLRQRVYHWVMKTQKVQNTEQVLVQYDSDDTMDMDDLVSYENKKDTYTEHELVRAEGIASIPWDKIQDKEHIELINEILIKRHSIEDIAKSRKTSVRAVTTQFDELCQLIYNIQVNGDKVD